MTKPAQIQEAIRPLPPAEQQELRQWLLEEESPGFLAAVDEAEQSLAKEGGVPLTEARRNLRPWIATQFQPAHSGRR